MATLTNQELDRICQDLTVYQPPFYAVCLDFVCDLYTTGCRPEELIQYTRWIQSIIDPDSWELTPEKGNFSREIKKCILSDNLNAAIVAQVRPYESLTIRQLEYSMKQIFPIETLFAITKIIVAYPFRYNAVRRLLDSGYTQLQISSYFGWVSPTIIATYTTRDIDYFIGTIPAQTYYLWNSNCIRLIDSNGDFIIST